MIFLMPHKNIFRIHFSSHLHATEVVQITTPNFHLCTVLIICNVPQLDKIITNKWQLLFPLVCPILLMLLKHLERCEALAQFGFHPCFQFIKHPYSMCCFPINGVHIMGNVNRTSILSYVVYMIITYFCHIRMKLQLLNGKLSNVSTFF